MNIFEYAKKMEKDGEAYYRTLAGKINEKGLKTITLNLADAEVKHYNILLHMEKGQDPALHVTDVLKDARNIFSTMPWDEVDRSFSDHQINMYQKALEIEKQSREFYEQKAQEVKTEGHKEIFLRIAGEENRHYILIDEILEFMKRPQQWLENAEWHHSDEY